MDVCGSGPLELCRLLKTWLELVGRETPPAKEYASWRYQERAIVSTLAGAVWASEGFALEDFRYHKRESRPPSGDRPSSSVGRCDLWFRLQNGKAFVLEAKHGYKSLNLKRGSSRSVFNTRIRDAANDARRLFEYDHSIHPQNAPRHLALAAVTAVLDTDIVDLHEDGNDQSTASNAFDYERHKSEWIQGLKSFDGLKAWHFSDAYKTKHPDSNNPDWIYPGVGLILQTVD